MVADDATSRPARQGKEGSGLIPFSNASENQAPKTTAKKNATRTRIRFDARHRTGSIWYPTQHNDGV